MPVRIRMKAVRIFLMKITGMGVEDRIKPADAIEIDDRNSPNIGSFFDRLYILIYIQANSVRIRFVRLDIVIPEFSISAMYRGQQYDLFRRIIRFQIR